MVKRKKPTPITYDTHGNLINKSVYKLSDEYDPTVKHDIPVTENIDTNYKYLIKVLTEQKINISKKDELSLYVLASEISTYKICNATMEKDGMTITKYNGDVVAHPCIAIRNKAFNNAMMLIKEYGFTMLSNVDFIAKIGLFNETIKDAEKWRSLPNNEYRNYIIGKTKFNDDTTLNNYEKNIKTRDEYGDPVLLEKFKNKSEKK